MQQPKGIAVVLGVIFGLAVVGVLIAGIFFFTRESKIPTPAGDTNVALQLSCTTDADCVSYCGADPCYQPVCGVTATGAASSCTCRSLCGPIVTGGNNNTNGNVNISKNSNTNTSTNSNTNSAVNTTGWKTYTNDGLKYSFQYPQDWLVEDKASDAKRVYCVAEWPDCAWSLTVETTDKSLEGFITSYNTNTSNADRSYTQIYKQEKIILNKHQGTKLFGSTTLGIDAITIYIPHNGRNYTLSYSPVQLRADIGNTILSTFTFTE
jgi:hypothetical protein